MKSKNKKWISFFSVGFVLWVCFACKFEKQQTLFQKLDPNESGIQFQNKLEETETENILSYEYFYNGGGVGVGDFDNDGFLDVFLTANQEKNRLYLNKGLNGKIEFSDETEKVGIFKKENSWATGCSIVDINNDGWLDIYVCYSGNKPAELRKNQLFINKGKDKSGTIRFEEEAEKFGIADDSFTTTAGFLDFDNDGDLDLFVLNHNLRGYQRKEAAQMRESRDEYAGDKLFENQNGKFVDVSEKAGIKANPMGFGLGLAFGDVNHDGWTDIYVTNDYVEDDYLYINQKNGVFKEAIKEHLGHTSQFSMGVEIADFNNDQLADIFTLDMLPEDNYRQKLLIWPDNWTIYQAQLKAGFWHQNMRNMLHIAEKNVVTGKIHYAEVAQQWGVSNTDWSWSALAADFDLDGYRDLFITNGIGKDYTDADFVKYYYDDKAQRGLTTTLLDDLKKMPSTPTKNYIFRNVAGTHFENQQKEWGFDEISVASGAAAADFDNDGDIDIISNRLNEYTQVYENKQQKRNSISIELKGDKFNSKGIGAKVIVYIDTKTQLIENFSTHGFQSSIVSPLVVGLGESMIADSIQVIWSNKKTAVYKKVKAGTKLKLDEANASVFYTYPITGNVLSNLSFEINEAVYQHQNPPINDFDIQALLPKSYSYVGARMATADFDGDKQEDIFYCGTVSKPGELWFANGRKVAFGLKNQQDAVSFDLENDGDNDLYIACGGYSDFSGSSNLQDECYINLGNGKFTPLALPIESNSASFVKKLDCNHDGYDDLLVGGYVQPQQFPKASETFLLINNKKGNFIKKSIGTIGITTDAVLTDYNQDGWEDVIIVGEFMSIMLYKNNKGNLLFDKIINESSGLWNRIIAEDLDNDGKEELVVGNLGTNTQLRASSSKPMVLYYGDVDNNGVLDPIFSYYIKEELYPALGRDNIIEQLPFLRKTFIDYKSFATTTAQQLIDLLPPNSVQSSKVTTTATMIFKNQNGNFKAIQLPNEVQRAPVHAILNYDIDNDGKKELLMLGNDDKFRLRFGKMDSNKGVILKANEPFKYQFYGILGVEGDIRDAKVVSNKLILSKNNGETSVIQLNKPPKK